MKFQGDSAKLKILAFIDRCLGETCAENYTVFENQIFNDFWESQIQDSGEKPIPGYDFLLLCPQSTVTWSSFSKFIDQDSNCFEPFIHFWCISGLLF